MSPTVWTPRRKVLGNLVPALFWLPTVGYGILQIAKTSDLLGDGLLYIGLGSVLGWLALNAFGLFENRKMRAELERLLKVRGEKFDCPTWFVGFATPRHVDLLDAHEDVGYLFLEPDQLRFVSQTRTLKIPRTEVARVRYRANIHTWLGLGRWVSAEGLSGEKEYRLLVEPRESGTMLGNLIRSARLRGALESWLRSGSIPVSGTSAIAKSPSKP